MKQEIILLKKQNKINWWVKKSLYKSNLYWTLSYFCFTSLIYIEHFLILASIITGCISISAFTSLIGIPIGITIFAVGLKVFSIAGGIKKYKSIIKKKNMIKQYC